MPILNVTMLTGRNREQKRRLIAELTTVMVEVAGARREEIAVVLHEVAPDHWGRGGVPLSETGAASAITSDSGTPVRDAPPTAS
jgi:4-oxalocrotonate tautomerase